ncbi:MAG: SPOCS domain-containing protein [Lachnospiraceae bacterium]
MELVKKNIHMNKLKGKAFSQMTLDEDFNLSEIKPDAVHVILNQGEVVVDTIKVQQDKVVLRGKFSFEILYASEGTRHNAENYMGNINFEESVSMPGVELGDHVTVRWDIEDMTASLINSRKFRINALVTFQLKAESFYDEETTEEIQGGDCIQMRMEEQQVVQLKNQKKDTFRIKEEIELSSNKPNIDQLLWRGMHVRSISSKPMENQVDIQGELVIFAIYAGEEEHIPIQWVEKNIPFQGSVPVEGCSMDMILMSSVNVIHREMEARPDGDGENRIIGIDMVLELDMKLYSEERISILSDIYSPKEKIIPKYGEAFFESLLVRNAAKCKIVDKLHLPESERILQICHSNGSIKIDRVIIDKNNLKIEGALTVTILYMEADDNEPMRSYRGAVPFSYEAEANGVDENCFYELTPSIEQLTCIMSGEREAEVRAVAALDLLVLKRVAIPTISAVTSQSFDVKEVEQIAGIVGYIVKPNDSLWDIAKKYYTTIDAIMENNELSSRQLKGGERILLIKQGMCL